jgi:3-oxoacyl-[acyl-carrier protein] reductase
MSYFWDVIINNLNGGIVWVTGVSHSKGIGTAICRKLALEGADIFFTHRGSKDNWVTNLQDEIQGNGARCANLEIDFSESNAHLNYLIQLLPN